MIEKVVSVLYEYRLELAAAFAVFDTNADGTISAAEFSKTLQSLTSLSGGAGITDMQAMELLKALDTNGDGSISYEEFVAGFRLAEHSSSGSGSGSGSGGGSSSGGGGGGGSSAHGALGGGAGSSSGKASIKLLQHSPPRPPPVGRK